MVRTYWYARGTQLVMSTSPEMAGRYLGSLDLSPRELSEAMSLAHDSRRWLAEYGMRVARDLELLASAAAEAVLTFSRARRERLPRDPQAIPVEELLECD
jgi:hypothetical protein